MNITHDDEMKKEHTLKKEIWQYRPAEFCDWVNVPEERYTEYKSFDEYQKAFSDLKTRNIFI